jgi:hypothetical protein
MSEHMSDDRGKIEFEWIIWYMDTQFFKKRKQRINLIILNDSESQPQPQPCQCYAYEQRHY